MAKGKKSANDATAAPPLRLTGKVETIYRGQSETFTAGVIRTSSGSHKFRFTGMLSIGEMVTMLGQWVENPTYGRQFVSTEKAYDIPLDSSGVVAYLANHPSTTGLGPAKAQKLVNAAGSREFGEFLAGLTNEVAIARVARECQLTITDLLNVREVWESRSHQNAVATWLASAGLTHYQITTLLNTYGNRCRDVLMDNPYLLLGVIKGFGFAKCDQIALKLGTPKDAPPRVRAAIKHTLEEEIGQGHTWCERSDLESNALKLLSLDTLNARSTVAASIDGMVTMGELHAYDHHADDGLPSTLIALHHALDWELQVMEYLRTCQALAGTQSDPDTYNQRMEAIDEFSLTIAHPLNDLQRQAALNALLEQFSIITGGAGTGKTYTLNAIVSVALSLGWTVGLAAPTGKAAKRMQQVIGQPAQTIHRLLGWNPHSEEPEFNANNPLDYDLLIVDETSMLSLPMACMLLNAIDATRTRVVFVGDANQLPPIQAGNLLRDIVRQKLAPVTALTEVMRQAGDLKINAQHILHGRLMPTSPAMVRGVLEPWYVFTHGAKGASGSSLSFTDPLALRQFLLDSVEMHLPRLLANRQARNPAATPVDLLWDIQVLAPQNVGVLGCDQLNAWLQWTYQRMLYGVELPIPAEAGVGEKRKRLSVPLRVGDKVINNVNDYGNNVMNGEIGRVVRIDPADIRGGGTVIRWGDDRDAHEVLYVRSSPELFSVSLAYALTIHKVQGSEFPIVISVIHRIHYNKSRALAYTAATRARLSHFFLGDGQGLNQAIKTQVDTSRNTFMSLHEWVKAR